MLKIKDSNLAMMVKFLTHIHTKRAKTIDIK